MSLEKIPDVLRALVEEHVDYVLIGAVAMMTHGLVRATEYLDFFVRPDPDNIGRLRAALRRVFPDDPAIDEISHEDLRGDYPAVRYNTPDESFGIDILARLGEAFAYEGYAISGTTLRRDPCSCGHTCDAVSNEESNRALERPDRRAAA